MRLTPSYASARKVVISSRSPRRAAPMVPNSRPVSQVASAHPCSSFERLVGVRVGGEVEVVAEPAEQRVAHRTADQVQLVAGGGEPAAELVGDRRDPQQFGDGAALGGGQLDVRGGQTCGRGAAGHGAPTMRMRRRATADRAERRRMTGAVWVLTMT